MQPNESAHWSVLIIHKIYMQRIFMVIIPYYLL